MLISGSCRRFGSVLLLGLMQAWSTAVAQQPIAGTAVPCERNSIIAPGGVTSTLVVCARVERSVPELKAQLAQLESRLTARDDETRHEIVGLGRALNTLARQLKPADVDTLARTLAARLSAFASAPDARMFAELSRLRIDLREVNEKIDSLRAAPATASRTEAELLGSTGAALGQMEFAHANAMLDGLARVETKIDAMSRDLRDLAHPAEAAAVLDSDRRIAKDAWKRFLDAGGQLRCPVLHTELGRMLLASSEAEESSRLLVARNLLMTVMTRSMQATAELQNADRLAQSRRDAYQSALSRLEFDVRELDRDMAHRQSLIDESRRRLLDDRAQLEARWQEQEQQSRAAVKTVGDRVARARADLAAAAEMPTKTEDEAQRRVQAVMQLSQVLQIVEEQLANALRHSDSVAQQARVQLSKPPPKTILTQLEAEQQRALQAKGRSAAVRQQATALASSGQLDEAVEAIRLGQDEANALRHGREVAPRPRSTLAPDSSFQACR